MNSLLVVAVTFASGLPVEAQYTINHNGYRISSSVPKSMNHSVVTIKKGGKTLAVHREGIAQSYGSKVELISLLNSAEKQLVVSQYTGGNHCCTVYWIYDLTPRFRLLFQSKDFETVGYNEVQKLFQNIDRDRDLEIVDNSPAFHYFDNLAFVSSPSPRLIFDYDRRTRKFVLANRRFDKYLLREQRKEIVRTRGLVDSNSSQYLVNTFGIFLDFVYAGKLQDGWKYYHDEKGRSNLGQFFHSDAIIRQTLDGDPGYRSIYNK